MPNSAFLRESCRFTALTEWVSFIVLTCTLSTFSAAQERASRVRTLAEIRHEGVVIQKWDISCGAAALATLLTYDLHNPVTERQVATAMLHRTDPIRVRTRGGFSLLNMQEYAEARGYQADGYGQLTFADLPNLLPAIVPVEFHGYDHFVVVRKIQQDQVFFADPAYGRRAISTSDFKAAWKNKIAFVITPK
jgi:predicted double-glycine peptidase